MFYINLRTNEKNKYLKEVFPTILSFCYLKYLSLCNKLDSVRAFGFHLLAQNVVNALLDFVVLFCSAWLIESS